MSKAKFIYDSSSKNADLYYATKFGCHDPFIFLQCRGRKYLVMSDLEVDRAKNQAEVDDVLSLSKYMERAKMRSKRSDITDVLSELFKDFGVRKLLVPQTTSFTLVDGLRRKGYNVEAGPIPFFPSRFVKSKEERGLIEKSQRAVFSAMGMARDILKRSRIKGDRLIYRGRGLTSDILRTLIDVHLLERGYVAEDTIVACGRHSIDPHDIGSGPLKPHSSIIIDIFPRSIKTRYYGDATRTFCRGRAPIALKRMYGVVKEGQEMGVRMVKAGANGRMIHEAIKNFFEKGGYPTCERRGRQVGFFHGTGHSIGLEVHEEPARINQSNYKLKAGIVTSVEPGLYYPEIGGVRIEDLVYVTKRGCDMLAGFPKKLEIL